MSSKIVKSLSTKFELLRHAVLGEDIVLITGLPSTGKTTLAKLVLEEYSEYLDIYINCNNIVTTSMLYLEILKQMSHQLDLKPAKKARKQHMINSVDFRERYNGLYKQALESGYERIFIVLDQIELFKKTPMMEAIVHLTSESNIDFILISGENGIDLLDGIHSNNYRLSLEDRFNVIELNAWSKEDLIETIIEQLPSESTEVYKKYVQNVVSTVYMNTTKDFVELRSFCQENFQDFLSHYENRIYDWYSKIGEEVDLDGVDYDNFEEELPASLITSSISTFFSSFKDSLRRGKDPREWGRLEVDTHMALHTAALIISAYIAAYTRRSDDKKNFISFQKRMSKRTKQDHYDNDPKPFDMERLIHIYQGIIMLTANIKDDSASLRYDSMLSDIQLLQDLDLISVVSGNGLDSQTRFKISYHLTYNYVRSLSGAICFELDSLIGIPTVAN